MDKNFHAMNNSIFVLQNDPYLLKCLVAQRAQYSKAKRKDKWKAMFTLGFAIISVFAAWLDFEWLTAISSLLSVSLLVCTRYIDKSISKDKHRAASIQQFFDATIYSQALGNVRDIWGGLPTTSELAEAIAEIPTDGFNTVKNWYSDYSTLPKEKQIYYSQRENIRWDKQLRKEYGYMQITILLVETIVLIVSFIAVNPSFVKFICVCSWYIPIMDFLVSAYFVNRADIKRLVEINSKFDRVETNITEKVDRCTIEKLVELQRYIQNNRIHAHLIPDWFYSRRQTKHQKHEDAIAETMTTIVRQEEDPT